MRELCTRVAVLDNSQLEFKLSLANVPDDSIIDMKALFVDA